MSKVKVYFPGLNGLRFLAAAAVIFTHIELIKKFLGFGSHWLDLDKIGYTTPLEAISRREISWLTPFISNAGPLGVIFFFVLSGFLITYLLFVEMEATGTIGVKKFYLRRILRIWPLYFVMVILGFFVLPHFSFFEIPQQQGNFLKFFWENFILFILFLPNLAFSIYQTAVPNIGQLWSIGVEEQFYLIWPWVIRKAKNFIRVILLFTIGILIIKTLVLFGSKAYPVHWMLVLKKFFAMSKLECMSIGALGAYVLYYKREKLLRFIYHPAVLVISVLCIPVGIIVVPMRIQDGIHLVYSVSSLILILNVSTNPKCFLKLENKVLDYLGKISYGIYMYHMMVAAFVLHFAKYILRFNSDLGPMESVWVYLAVLIITILVASLSYHLIEIPFIRKKKSVSTVISGDNAQESNV